MTEYESLKAQHKILKDENKRREHKLLFEAIDNLTAERDALKADAERLRNDLAAMNNSFNALKSELDTANEPCAWCAGNR